MATPLAPTLRERERIFRVRYKRQEDGPPEARKRGGRREILCEFFRLQWITRDSKVERARGKGGEVGEIRGGGKLEKNWSTNRDRFEAWSWSCVSFVYLFSQSRWNWFIRSCRKLVSIFHSFFVLIRSNDGLNFLLDSGSKRIMRLFEYFF